MNMKYFLLLILKLVYNLKLDSLNLQLKKIKYKTRKFKVASRRLKACNFIKEDTQTQVISSEFCKILSTPIL